MVDLARLVVRLEGESAKLRSDLDKSSKRLGRFEKRANKTAKSIQRSFKGIGAAAVGFLSIRSFDAFIDSFAKQEQAVFQLEARLKSTGAVAGKTSEELQKTATQLQKITTFGDEDIIGLQALLLTFTQIQSVNFDKATTAILNVATALDTDLKSAALQVGKALNDPILGITALSRSGIQFTEDQKDLIKSLVETGKTAEAQAVILKELEVQFGGSAEAAAQGTGKIEQLKNSLGDLAENIGQGIVRSDVFNDSLKVLSDTADLFAGNTSIEEWVQRSSVEIKTLAILILQGANLFEQFALGLGALAAKIGILLDGSLSFSDKFKQINSVSEEFNADVKANDDALQKLIETLESTPAQLQIKIDAQLPETEQLEIIPPETISDFEGVDAALNKIQGQIRSINDSSKQFQMSFKGTPGITLGLESPTNIVEDLDKAQISLNEIQSKIVRLGEFAEKVKLNFDDPGSDQLENIQAGLNTQLQQYQKELEKAQGQIIRLGESSKNVKFNFDDPNGQTLDNIAQSLTGNFEQSSQALENVKMQIGQVAEATQQVNFTFPQTASIALDSVKTKVSDIGQTVSQIGIEFDQQRAVSNVQKTNSALQQYLDANPLQQRIEIVGGNSLSNEAIGSGSR